MKNRKAPILLIALLSLILLGMPIMLIPVLLIFLYIRWFKVGDFMPVLDVTTGKATPLKIVGTATWGSGSTFGATYLFVSDQQAKDFFTKGKDIYQSAWVATKQGADVEEVTKAVDKVPFLGDLPFLGRLFRRDTVTDKKSELLIFLTPRIMNSQAIAVNH